jgi:hypothetical protein
MTNSTTLSSVIALCGLFAAVTSGCKQPPNCPELGNCGGPVPVGNWALSPAMNVNGVVTPEHGSCTEELYYPAADPRIVGGQPITPARVPPIEPAVYDWCDQLITSSGTSIQTHAANFYTGSPKIGAATIRIEANGHWSAGITRTGTYVLDFPALCMREFGAMDGKPVNPMDPASPNGNVCKQLEVPLRMSGMGNGSYQNTTCEPNPDDPLGCLCAFDVQETGGPSGYYKVLNANTLVFLPGTNFPQTVTYCNKGDSLELTGTDGEYLFGTTGLRTLDLGKVVPNCNDGMNGPGEEGIDCGPGCPNACPAPAAP